MRLQKVISEQELLIKDLEGEREKMKRDNADYVEHLHTKYRWQDSLWRQGYRQVRHLRSVKEAFEPAIVGQKQLYGGIHPVTLDV